MVEVVVVVFHRVPHSVTVSFILRVVVEVTVYGAQVFGGGRPTGALLIGDVSYAEESYTTESVGGVVSS